MADECTTVSRQGSTETYQQPKLAEGEQIIGAPTLIEELPPPLKRFVGDLSNLERVLVGLDLTPPPNCEKDDDGSQS